ncbi:EF-P 5-aminopentanol modification-associated protein YfmH [Secundilactobacillus malefermentans]|uniref:Peptidase M16 N-terminal domain-containing protein n=2 Tax=Secundilactobacillus malefermentans TaxID=176292 RepID=A0A4R5NIE3_9LACO|nr:pitrilysin family protein [Secundilactobacillus malefermentans]KRM59225.1 Zn-dependent peptidase [Secundilactobacillus malefermentans DSM 5705 = KCTC 3548]QEA32196.1 insulinase family protein [Secundilactobacillus malefermentans]TDG74353.1 hypothetical protein C5L31_000920 [Secundilactobacillus malefermentans]
MMQEKNYSELKETIFSQVLDNGLTIHLLPKPEFSETYAVLSTNYGSIDNQIIPNGQTDRVQFPDGLAHFLEHKMFEKKDYDAADVFAKYGASTNAYTSFTKTSYLFSATNYLKENLMNLLDFVQTPYFSHKTVTKEVGIIGQEILMYEDDPNWQAYFGAIASMYDGTAMSTDIAGTVDSIQQITPETLYLAHQQFYQPSNMSLFVVGKFDKDTVLAWVAENQNQKTLLTHMNPTRIKEDYYDKEIVHNQTLKMKLQRPRVTIGIKGIDQVPTGFDGLVYEEAVNTMLDLLFGESSDNYLSLYDEGIIDDSFGYSFEIQRGSHFAIFAGETNRPDEMATRIKSILLNAEQELERLADRLEVIKREAIGATLLSMNSLSTIANDYDDNLFGGTGLFDEIAAIRQLEMPNILKAAKSFVNEEMISIRKILPSE